MTHASKMARLLAGMVMLTVASAADAQPGCFDFVTGGGWITLAGKRANFGFNAGTQEGATEPAIRFNLIDHNTKTKIRATGITGYGPGPTPNSRRLEGPATVNGEGGVTYVIIVTDNGEPGKGNDTISITLSNGFSVSGMLSGGNIKLHDNCP